MTPQDVDKAFQKAIASEEFENLELTKYQRYNYRHRENGLAKKLEVLFLLDKLEIKK